LAWAAWGRCGVAPQPKIVLVENFFEELKRLVPAN
jgi:hypothetical protein